MTTTVAVVSLPREADPVVPKRPHHGPPSCAPTVNIESIVGSPRASWPTRARAVVYPPPHQSEAKDEEAEHAQSESTRKFMDIVLCFAFPLARMSPSRTKKRKSRLHEIPGSLQRAPKTIFIDRKLLTCWPYSRLSPCHRPMA